MRARLVVRVFLILVGFSVSVVYGSSSAGQQPVALPRVSSSPTNNKDPDASQSFRPWRGFRKPKTAAADDSEKSDSPSKSRRKKGDNDDRHSPVADSISNSTTASLYRRFRRPTINATTAVSVSQEKYSKRSSKDEEHAKSSQTNSTTAPAPASNTTTAITASDDANVTIVQPVPSPNSGILLLAPASAQGSFRYNMGRSGASFAQLSKQSQQQQQQLGGLPSNALIAHMELWLVPILSLVTRYWVLPTLTSWLTRHEDSIQPTQRFAFERLNDRYDRDAQALQNALQQPPTGMSRLRWKQLQRQAAVKRTRVDSSNSLDKNTNAVYSKTVIVIELNSMTMEQKLHGESSFDLKALADIVAFLLQQHRAHAFGTDASDPTSPAPLEVVLLVTSPGGSVSSFGLAAAHVQRLAQEYNIHLTVSVDLYAASGGYMIASQAHTLLAAPFATIGSVGVIMEALNVNELLKRYGIQPLVIKAGVSKNPISRYGQVTNKDLAHEQKSLERVHDAFKDLIVEGRPALQDNLGQVADGSVWLGREALELNLVDEVMTSSEYIQQRIESSDRVLKLHRANPNRNLFRLSPALDLVPHLKSWAVERLTGEGAAHTLSFLFQVAGACSMIHRAFFNGPR